MIIVRVKALSILSLGNRFHVVEITFDVFKFTLFKNRKNFFFQKEIQKITLIIVLKVNSLFYPIYNSCNKIGG